MIKPMILAGTLLALLCVSGTALPAGAQTSPAAKDKADIEALEQSYNEAFNAKNVNGVMACYAPGKGLFVFDALPPPPISELGCLQERLGGPFLRVSRHSYQCDVGTEHHRGRDGRLRTQHPDRSLHGKRWHSHHRRCSRYGCLPQD